MGESRVFMEMGFNVIYLIYIICIVSAMAFNRKYVPTENLPSANRVLTAFSLLLIGDIGHVGARLIAFFGSGLDQNPGILGYGSLFEALGIVLLYLFWLEAWRVEYKKDRTPFYFVLVAIGIIGLIILLMPQNNWTAHQPPYEWFAIRNIAWSVIGITVSILLFIESKGDRLMKRIAICIFISFFFYLPVVYFGYLAPMLGMLMIPGTIVYMIWEYTSLKRFFLQYKK